MHCLNAHPRSRCLRHELQGKTPDDIVTEFPELTLGDVHAALTYFWDNQGVIREEMLADEDFVEQLRAVTGPGPLERKLSGTDRQSDSVSS